MRVSTRKSIPIGFAAALLCAGTAFAGSAFAGTAFAAPAGPAAQLEPLLPQVVIEAGSINHAVVGRGLMTGAPIESTTVDYHVSYADLDLLQHADVLTLQQRVADAAAAACQQLDELFPVQQSHRQTRACVEDATRGASGGVQQALAQVQLQEIVDLPLPR